MKQASYCFYDNSLTVIATSFYLLILFLPLTTVCLTLIQFDTDLNITMTLIV